LVKLALAGAVAEKIHAESKSRQSAHLRQHGIPDFLSPADHGREHLGPVCPTSRSGLDPV
jgi:hypothetical protein